jgi:ABC-type nitrate/sulfonate/bicarbonate transport system permease component
VEGLNRGYVVIMAFTEAIPIAMLVPLQLIWLGVTTGTVLVPGCGMGWVVRNRGERA